MSGNLKITLPDSLWQFFVFFVAVLISLVVILVIILALIYYGVSASISSEAAVATVGVASDNALPIAGILFVPAAIFSWFVTRIKVRNRRLTERLELNEQLLEMVNDLIFIHYLDGKCIYASKMDREYGDSKGDELMRMDPQMLNDLIYKELIKPRINELIETRQVTFESTHVHRDVIP